MPGWRHEAPRVHHPARRRSDVAGRRAGAAGRNGSRRVSRRSVAGGGRSGDGGLRQSLADAGYVEGRNVVIDARWAEGQYDRLPAMAAEMVRRQVAVIVATGGTAPALAAKAATTTIPIVFSVTDDPVALGLVASLARPGGNATGVTFLLAELGAKQLGLLRELVPAATRIGLLVNPNNTTSKAQANDVAAGRVCRRRDNRDRPRQRQPRDRGGLRGARPQPGRGAHGRHRSVPVQPARPARHSGGASRRFPRSTRCARTSRPAA